MTAGKHLMPRLDAATFASDAQYRERSISFARDLGVAGFCVFGGGAHEVGEAVRGLNAAATADLIFSADCEFGLPMRFTCGTEFPDAMAIARTGETELAHKIGAAIAKEMRAIGLGWNFAPVADVNSNPENPIINTRAFGDDPNTVANFAIAYMLGLQSEGVIATAKHFPGHGDTSVDSHRTLPYLNGGLARFEHLELAPFKSLIDAGVQSVMTGHLATPSLLKELGSNESSDIPATLSRTISTTLLRTRLGFGGIVVTDAMEMRAIRNIYGDAEAAKMAFEAGADVVLMPPDVEAAFEALSPVLPRPYAIPRSIFAGPIESLNDLASEHAALALDVARRSMAVTGPLDVRGRELVVLTDDRPDVDRKASDFISRTADIFSSVRRILPGNEPELNSLNGNTILAVFHRARGYIDADATEWTIPRMMRDIADRSRESGNTLAGLLLFGNPYLDRHFTTLPRFVLKSYSESTPSIVAASDKLLEAYRSQ